MGKLETKAGLLETTVSSFGYNLFYRFMKVELFMGPVICPKHGAQFFTSTTPDIAKAVKAGQLYEESKLRRLIIKSDEKERSYWVDEGFLQSFEVACEKIDVVLRDRSYKEKNLRDRLLIVKILKAMVAICPK